MSQSQTELGRLLMELDLAKKSATDTLIGLKANLELKKESCNQACAELKSTRESSSEAQKELESLRRELKNSWELEAELQT